MTKRFGLIGYPLEHSFSSTYFTDKFVQLGLDDHEYVNLETPNTEALAQVLKEDFIGLNVTIPFKREIINWLNAMDRKAWAIGAVNTIVRIGPHSWKGFNTDMPAFKASLRTWFTDRLPPARALILGTGGAARAVLFACKELGIKTKMVSGTGRGDLSYEELDEEIMRNYKLIINATPLGMYPNVDVSPPIPYHLITEAHWLFDLIYNPSNTVFLARGQQQGARIKNGLEMLHLQAEHAWSIWNLYGQTRTGH